MTNLKVIPAQCVRSSKSQSGFTMLETLIAALISAISMYFLISMTQDFRRASDSVRSTLIIRDYMSSTLNNIRANPAAHQVYFSSDYNDIADFLNQNISIAFDNYQFTTVQACPHCPGRGGFVMYPLDTTLYRGIYRVNFCGIWERDERNFDCERRSINFIVSQ